MDNSIRELNSWTDYLYTRLNNAEVDKPKTRTTGAAMVDGGVNLATTAMTLGGVAGIKAKYNKAKNLGKYAKASGGKKVAKQFGLHAKWVARNKGRAIKKTADTVGNKITGAGNAIKSGAKSAGTSVTKGAQAVGRAAFKHPGVAIGIAAAAVAASLFAAYKLKKVKRDGELYAYYSTSPGGTVTEERIASIPKSMNPDDLKSKVEETRAKLKAKGAIKIKFRVVYDKTKLGQIKENMSNLFKKKSNSREVLNSRCLEIYK
jgi:hypothetical protein